MSVQRDQIEQARKERIAVGKAIRSKVPRAAHALWSPMPDRIDPIDLLEQSSLNRLQSLIPIRYGRMLSSPFAFLRGSAIIMSYDLATTPVTDLQVQICGDAHLSNFGAYATPERHLVFGVNDFDETLPGPWEWDIKRLATSFILAARQNGLSAADTEKSATMCVQSYREQMRRLASMSNLAVWYYRLDDNLIQSHTNMIRRAVESQTYAEAERHTQFDAFPKLTAQQMGNYCIAENPPLITHENDEALVTHIQDVIRTYQDSLQDDHQALLSRYHIVDIARKVVGVGSVGTRCYVVLLMNAYDNEPLFLQIKEARESVLEHTWGKSPFANHAQRVVAGQRLMQAATDIFLGWTSGDGHDYVVRQLQDMKGSANIKHMGAETLPGYAQLCGAALARAHARSGNAAVIRGYLGKSPTFDESLLKFALSYAEQTERDYDALVHAVKTGRIPAETGI